MPTWDPRSNELFLEVRALPAAAERRAFLARACGGDAALEADVLSLLDADDRGGDRLERPVQLPSPDGPEGSPGAGTLVGPY